VKIEDLKQQIRNKAKEFGIVHTTIEIEFSAANCPTVDCVQK
jgi:hypothetical protein